MVFFQLLIVFSFENTHLGIMSPVFSIFPYSPLDTIFILTESMAYPSIKNVNTHVLSWRYTDKCICLHKYIHRICQNERPQTSKLLTIISQCIKWLTDLLWSILPFQLSAEQCVDIFIWKCPTPCTTSCTPPCTIHCTIHCTLRPGLSWKGP